jgi:hypothetical protein
MNPFSLTSAERLDAFPTLGNPKCTEQWLVPRGDTQAQPSNAWQLYLAQYVRACGVNPPFILDTHRRNRDEEVRDFLALRRKLVRNYLDRLGLVTLPVFHACFRVIRNEHSWWLRAEARIIERIPGIQIGRGLQLKQRWIRTHCPEYRGSQSWHRWLQWGITRVGFSTSGTDYWVWYEIRCPHNPGIDGEIRHLDTQAFDAHIAKIWIPIVKNLRWWSTSNPRLWNF